MEAESMIKCRNCGKIWKDSPARVEGCPDCGSDDLGVYGESALTEVSDD